jgi:hypothetical protein
MNTSNTTTTNAMQGASLLRANAGRDLTCTWRPGVCKRSCRHCIDEAEAIPSGPVDNCKANSTPTSSLEHTGFQQEKSINHTHTHTHTHVCTQRYIYIYIYVDGTHFDTQTKLALKVFNKIISLVHDRNPSNYTKCLI